MFKLTRSKLIALTNKQTNRRRWKHPTFFATLRRWVKRSSAHGQHCISAEYKCRVCRVGLLGYKRQCLRTYHDIGFVLKACFFADESPAAFVDIVHDLRLHVHGPISTQYCHPVSTHGHDVCSLVAYPYKSSAKVKNGSNSNSTFDYIVHCGRPSKTGCCIQRDIWPESYFRTSG